MERFIHIPELIHLTCKYMDKKTGYAMARTCSTFLEPALDTIWREVDTLEGLIACLPEELWIREERQTNHLGKFGILIHFSPNASYPTSKDLDRYRSRYAHRIRVMYPPSYDPTPVFLDPQVYQALHLATDGEWGALSPKLQNLTWVDPLQDEDSWRWQYNIQNSEDIAPFMSLFLAPTVTSIAVGLYKGSPANEAAIHSASRRLAPNLKSLHAYMDMEKEHYTHEYLTCYSWPSLTNLTIPLDSVSTIPFIGSLPKLVDLTIEVCCIVPLLYTSGGPMPEWVVQSRAFRTLEILELRDLDDCSPSIVGILQHIPPHNNLRSVGCSFHPEPQGRGPAASTQLLVTTFKNHLNPETLESIHVEGETNGCTAREQNNRDAYDLELREETDITPLSEFRRLKKLSFNVWGGVRFTPAEIRALPAAWPHLQELDLRPIVLPTRTPDIDHTHIVELASGCSSSLRVLGVLFDGTKVTGTVPSQAGPSGRGHGKREVRLEVLKTWGSLIASPTRMTAFIASSFPMLRRIETKSPYDYMSNEVIYRKRWDGVANTLGLGQA